MRNCIFILFLVLVSFAMKATHNRAGEITYKQTGSLTIEMTITTYTKASSVAADRDSLDVYWGDGSHQFVVRNNGLTRNEPNDIKVNFYIATHTYPGVASYTISFLDPNRVAGILNVNYPNSIDIPFFLSTTFTLLDQQFQGFNNSAILLQSPIDIGCVNKPFIHNPNAYDADGDSLAYELTAPLQAVNSPVPGYKLPDEIGSPQGNAFTINPLTGEVRWDSPKLQGEYNIAIKIKEYRNGHLINVILRDMQILIRACENEPPEITSIDEMCVIAGQKVVIDIIVDDPNKNQKVRLTATGGPFSIESPAKLNAPPFFTNVDFNARIEWQTTCNHISEQYYQIVLRAVDNFYPDSTGLATLKTIRIKVVGPPPINLTSKSGSNQIDLEWDNPYSCEITDQNYFQGFSVWRKIATTNYLPDTCNPGLTKSPYTRIAFKIKTMDGNKYTFSDTKIENGNTYCYRIQADFAKLTAANNPYNRVESLPSNETCIILLRDVPLITKVSVINTSNSKGEIEIKWVKPLAEQLDTSLNPGPYIYKILRADGGMNFIPIHNIASPFFLSKIDSIYIDKGLNTIENQYFYSIEIYSQGQKHGESPSASSVFLKANPSDKKIELYWESEIPWSNLSNLIFRKAVFGNFELIGTSNQPSYTDSSVSNDSTYCYKVETIGTYSIPAIETPLLNFSQEICLMPIDNVPSCPPKTDVKNICDVLTSDFDPADLFNTVTWSNPKEDCPTISNDLAFYNIYYGETILDSLVLIQTQAYNEPLKFLHHPVNGLLGCYAVTSVDKLGNESAKSNVICVDNCPFYELPNTFTPNGDGHNDVFKPRINLFISRIELQVYNQWGNLVFETTDPNINWDGSTSGKMLSAGTYHYVCKIFEKRVTGEMEAKQILSGFIHIIRD